MPRVVLWAWERPENLTFINVRSTGVAVLEGTAAIAVDGSVRWRMRTQPLTLPPGAEVLPVVRIESSPDHAPIQLEPLLSELVEIAKLPGIRGVQIDFDARRSERAFYRRLLTDLHRRAPTPISVTALASWCEGDRWLDAEPIAEAVPMFFRIGPGESREMQLDSPVCRSSVGLSIDEPWPSRRPAGIARVYVFDPRPWTPEAYAQAMRQILDWK